MNSDLKLQQLVDELNNYLVITEGKRDKQCLIELGVNKAKIVTLNNGKPLAEFTDEIARFADKVVILTDFDREGKKLASKLLYFLLLKGVKVDVRLRGLFRKIFKVTQIEELRKYLKGGEIYGKSSSRKRKIYYKSKIRGRGNHRKARRNWSNFWPNGGVTRL